MPAICLFLRFSGHVAAIEGGYWESGLGKASRYVQILV